MKTRILISLLLVVAATFKVAATDRFFVEDILIPPGQTLQVDILLENEAQYTAFQADLYLPDGLTVEEGSFALTSRKAADHTLSTSILPDGAIRLMSYSMRVNPYKGDSGALVTFRITASEFFVSPVTISLKHILFTTASGDEVAFSDSLCSVASFVLGDVNRDGVANIADVTVLIDLLLNNSEWYAEADVNLDGQLGIGDVTTLIDLLLN